MEKYEIPLKELVDEAERVVSFNGVGSVYVSWGNPRQVLILRGELVKRQIPFEIGHRGPREGEYYIDMSKVDLIV